MGHAVEATNEIRWSDIVNIDSKGISFKAHVNIVGQQTPSDLTLSRVYTVHCKFLSLFRQRFGLIAFSVLCYFFYIFFPFLPLTFVLIQSQSLSRRTTPFAPRVQVMGPVCRAQSLFGLCSLTVDWPNFLFPYFGKCISQGNGSFEFPSVQCIVPFSSL